MVAYMSLSVASFFSLGMLGPTTRKGVILGSRLDLNCLLGFTKYGPESRIWSHAGFDTDMPGRNMFWLEAEDCQRE